MQRLASSRRLLQAALAPGRAHSSRSAAAVATAPENGVAAPKMPPFDYTPPPYDGPRLAEIARKRAEFLSPSLFHFYDRPVRVPSHSLPPPIFLERTRLMVKKIETRTAISISISISVLHEDIICQTPDLVISPQSRSTLT
jgi:hypothetical protein